MHRQFTEFEIEPEANGDSNLTLHCSFYALAFDFQSF